MFRTQLPDRVRSPESPEEYVNYSLYLEAKTFLHGLLIVEDKLSMAHSLETRVPFLDNDLVDFAQRLPVRLKLRDLEHVVKLNENEPGAEDRQVLGEDARREATAPPRHGAVRAPEVTEQVKQGFSRPGRELVPRREHRLRPHERSRPETRASTSSSSRDACRHSSTST